jgi:hypothetical protein
VNDVCGQKRSLFVYSSRSPWLDSLASEEGNGRCSRAELAKDALSALQLGPTRGITTIILFLLCSECEIIKKRLRAAAGKAVLGSGDVCAVPLEAHHNEAVPVGQSHRSYPYAHLGETAERTDIL